MLFHPLIQNSNRFPTQAGIPYKNTYKDRTLYFKSTLTFLGPLSPESLFLPPDKNRKFVCFFIINIRECGRTLYVELARTIPPTNTNFRFTLLLTSGSTLYRASNLKSTITFLASVSYRKSISGSCQLLSFLAIN